MAQGLSKYQNKVFCIKQGIESKERFVFESSIIDLTFKYSSDQFKKLQEQEKQQMEESKIFEKQLQYCFNIFSQIQKSPHRFFSRQMVHNLCYILHHHFLLTTYQSQIVSAYLEIFIKVASDSDLQLLGGSIRAFKIKASISQQTIKIIDQKLSQQLDQEKAIKISSFYPSSKSKDLLIKEVNKRYTTFTNFSAKCDFLSEIMERIERDPDLLVLLQGNSGDLLKFINFYVAPVINQAKEEQQLKQVKKMKQIVENITGEPLPLKKQKSSGQQRQQGGKPPKKQKNRNPQGKFMKKEIKQYHKKKDKYLNFGKLKESLQALLVAIESDAITKQEINYHLQEIFIGQFPEKMQEQLFRFLEEKASGKLGLTDVAIIKKLMKGIRKQGWIQNFRLKIIFDKLKKFNSKQVHRGMREDEKELGRVSHKLKTESGFVPKFIRRLERDMMEVFEQNKAHDRKRAVEITLKRIEECIHELMDTEQEKFDFKLQPFGSYLNNFHLHNSDIDVAIVCPLNRKREISLLQKLAYFLNKNRYAHNIEIITKAKVPIIRFTDSTSSISIDLSCNNLLGSVNSQLIDTYRRFDERVHVLGISLKAILKHYGILGNGNGLSSYAYILMLIAFLQNTSPPILPNLQKQSLIEQDKSLTQKVKIMEFTKDGAKISSLNTVYCMNLEFALQHGLGEEVVNEKFASQLLFLFFHYYTYEFKHETMAISLRHGGFKPKQEKDEKFLFSIQDPFDPSNNPGKLVKSNSPLAEKLLKKFILIMKRIRQNNPIFY